MLFIDFLNNGYDIIDIHRGQKSEQIFIISAIYISMNIIDHHK